MSATETAATTIPGYVAGTWAIDVTHTDVSFTVRHLMVSKVRGRFTKFEGQIVTGENPLDSSVTATVDLSSIDTNEPNRDAHIRSADFFDVEQYPALAYRSTGLRPHGGDGYVVDGELSLHGVTKPVPLALELNGFSKDPWGGTRIGFSATATISRADFGIDFSIPFEGGGVVVGDKIQIALEVEGVLQG